MRPFGLLLAACLGAILLYDWASSPFLAGVLAAAPTSAAISSSLQETRLEKLQHVQVTTDILLVEYKQLSALESNRNNLRADLQQQMFGERLEKGLQATWKRWHSPTAVYDAWKEHLPTDKKEALIAEDDKRKELINQQEAEYQKALEDIQSEAAQTFNKKLNEFPISKQYWNQKSFVELLERERLSARAALIQN